MFQVFGVCVQLVAWSRWCLIACVCVGCVPLVCCVCLVCASHPQPATTATSPASDASSPPLPRLPPLPPSTRPPLPPPSAGGLPSKPCVLRHDGSSKPLLVRFNSTFHGFTTAYADCCAPVSHTTIDPSAHLRVPQCCRPPGLQRGTG